MQTNSEQSNPKVVPEAYRGWQNRAKALIEPLRSLTQAGKAEIPIDGPASDHDLNADRLESFARPLVLFAHWRRSLDHNSTDEDRRLSDPMELWFRDALLKGTDHRSSQYWGNSANFHQHSVEMGLLVLGLEISRDWLWSTFEEEERSQVLDWFESDVGNGHHWNNHMFFGIFILEFLIREGRGRDSYRLVINRWFDELEGMYHGEGWFMDGMNQAFDYYNAYAWHYYGLWWIRLYGESDPGRCDRWRSFAKRFLQDYPAFFASSGEHPAFGRSITYRFNATAPFGIAQLLNMSPVDPGLAREICERNVDFFLSKPIFQEQGCLSLGWYDPFPEMVESYSCGGSVYWAAKAFAPLLLDPDDAFWGAAKDILLASKGDSSQGFYVPSLVVRSVDGAVEIINAGSQIASTNTRFGPYKWGKLSYRTAVGFLMTHDPDRYPLDSGLTAEDLKSGPIYGRHYTTPIVVEENQIACLYSLGRKSEQFQISVETHMWWFRGWHLIVHQYNSQQPALLRHGGYALSNGDPESFSKEVSDAYRYIESDEIGVALQNLVGYDAWGEDERLSDVDGQRRHIQDKYHVLNTLELSIGRGSGYIACLSWAGEANSPERSPWSFESLEEGVWSLSHSKLGSWRIEDPFLPANPAKSL
ncbi:MAG: hypothetical protein CL828_06075 [Crocinitomicaceae bacterium]|nr:hypothetical protein [Crocinitomicaceae bacterium]